MWNGFEMQLSDLKLQAAQAEHAAQVSQMQPRNPKCKGHRYLTYMKPGSRTGGTKSLHSARD
jgi:hypothetical protein